MERVRESAIDDNLVFLVITAVMTMTAGMQWLLGTPPATLFFITLAFFAGSLAYAVPRIRRGRRKLRALRQGQDGERAVAEYLDTLAVTDGIRALHDIEGEGFNLDHVVISRHGIYVVETKTISKPPGSDARIVFDGERVRLDGQEPPRNPIDQARAGASWLRRLLKEALGRDYPVWPVLVFPGWFVETTPEGKKARIWVLEPKAIGPFLRREPMVLKDKDIGEVTTFLKRYVRSTPKRS